jgi:phosphopantothenate-cysteine ligase/phosphopantothenoylcysteine decarboxylase/phosphopantothenate--cysteine ligase
MKEELSCSQFDVVIHAAAVSDYRSAGVFGVAPGTTFDSQELTWAATDSPRLVEAAAGKIGSSHPELWLRLVPTPKLVDKIRSDWAFRGVLVKFKLEVGLTEPELLEVAEAARIHSQADLMVANTLEEMYGWAFLGGKDGYRKMPREQLADTLLDAVEGMASS